MLGKDAAPTLCRLSTHTPLQIVINNIVQYRHPLSLRPNPLPFQPPRLPFRSSRNPPQPKRSNHTTPHHSHCTRKALPVSRRILLPEYLRADGPADLPVAIDKADAERGARGSRGGLHTPGPHQREEGGGEGVADDRRGVNGAGCGVGY